MRLWSVHPRHLDRQGLTACWREALLAHRPERLGDLPFLETQPFVVERFALSLVAVREDRGSGAEKIAAGRRDLGRQALRIGGTIVVVADLLVDAGEIDLERVVFLGT